MLFEIKKTYNFSTLAPTLLGSDYTNLKVKAILTSEAAVKYSDIVSTHQTVKSTIKNLPDNVSDLTYILFENTDKTTMILPVEYIETDSVVEVSSINIRIDIPNVTVDDVNILKTRLKELGYLDFKVSLV